MRLIGKYIRNGNDHIGKVISQKGKYLFIQNFGKETCSVITQGQGVAVVSTEKVKWFRGLQKGDRFFDTRQDAGCVFEDVVYPNSVMIRDNQWRNHSFWDITPTRISEWL